MPPPPQTLLRFHGGLAGAFAPFAAFLAGVGWLALQGAPDERGFWPILLGAWAIGLVLARDRERYSQALLDGMSRPLVLLMVAAWLLAGVLSTLLAASGFVEAVVWVTRHIGIGGGVYAAAAFVVCSLVATSTGTSFGTILICGPLLYPAGGAVGAEPAVLLGAILGGATFGDSISPISDTTIASAGTQGADIGGTVKARFRYVAPAAGAAIVATVMLGWGDPASALARSMTASPRGLPMLLVPAVVVVMLLRKRHLVEALLGGAIAAMAVSLPLGLIAPGQLLTVEPGSYVARSLIIDGLERGLGVSVFTLLLVGLVATIEATGALQEIVRRVRARGGSARAAEVWIVGAVSGAVLVTTHSVVAVLTVGEFARETGSAAGIGSYRRANLLDLTVCTWPFLLPYFLPTILAANASASGVEFGMPRLAPWSAGLYNFYSWALVAMIVFAVVTGFGRGNRGSTGETSPLRGISS